MCLPVLIAFFALGCGTVSKRDASQPPPPDWQTQSTPARKVDPPATPATATATLDAPAVITPGQDLTVRIQWKSTEPATLQQTIPATVQLMRTDPPARLAGQSLLWEVGPGEGTVFATYRLSRVAPISLEARINDQQAETRTVAVGVVRLEMRITGPTTATVGDKVSYEARVVNAGQLPAQKVKLHAELDPGLDHPSAGREVELDLGTLGPGEMKTLNVSANVKSTGRMRSLARVSAEGAESVSQDVYIDARGARLLGELTGPQRLLIGETGTWTVKVTNKGNAPAMRVATRLPLPTSLKVDRIDEGGTVSGGIASWKIDSLAPGATRTLTLTGHAVAAVPKSSLLASFVADRVAESRADATFEAVGVPRLKLELHASEPSVDVGTPVIYTATLRNSGSLPLTGTLFHIEFPENMKPLHGFGATVPKIDGRRVSFAATSLAPGQAVEFRIEAVGTTPGDARIRASAQCPALPEPVQQDEATRIQNPAR